MIAGTWIIAWALVAGDYVTALEQALGQEEEDAEPIAWRAGALSLIETSDDPLLARASQNALEALAISPDLSDLAAREALQCHGAIGYTFEYDLQLWLKRGWALAAAYGDARQHRDRVADILGI